MHPLWVVRHQGRTFRIPPGTRSSVGRGAECDIVIDASEVSRCHAWLEPHDDFCFIEDAGSRNGVVVDGQTVRKAWLEPESWIQLGTQLLVVAREEGQSSQIRPRYRTPPRAQDVNVTLQGVSRTDAMLGVCEGLVVNGKLDAARDAALSLLHASTEACAAGAEPASFARIARSTARVVQLLGDENLAVALLRLHHVAKRVPADETIAALENVARTSRATCAAIDALVHSERLVTISFLDGVRLRRLQSMSCWAFTRTAGER